ncbi:efflux RND transporter periplasmic adaptor subunit [Segnochrobactrum spirostomi]|uniref:Efflux RND transporter periplasmic adaptor subunit n=1 Tax=Segnochrobactrum spirostomi TaxID=2608987 RepID=A0A6A7XYP4_9HYPH|nr:efflux RND transporter periplasmic adaptor subunit [Segnochrobactrum spirostomi]MQT11860.1 efflux RND transporter periplasmic adaptor subunit [Segnochrobactrum spirostomi]
MRAFVITLARMAVTLIVVAAAILVGIGLWRDYIEAPWTRDGRVLADVVEITPDVSGLVGTVLIRDNAKVRAGDMLFDIDRARYQLALDQADATLADRKAALDQADRDAERYRQLTNLSVSEEAREKAITAASQAQAAYDQAKSSRDLAALNLARTQIKAPVNGVVTNFDLRTGDYVTAGKGVAALVDTDSFYVAGYFEETKLARIAVGDPVLIRLMGQNTVLRGHVESIAAGIEDRESASGSNLLANVNPTFSWVRLAQRIPVRVALDPVPANVHLIAGLTATVQIKPGAGDKPASTSLFGWMDGIY